MRIGRDLEVIGHILVLGTVPACPEVPWKTMTTVIKFFLAAEFLMVALGCKWEVSVLVSSCYVRLGTACYWEVWRTEGRYNDTNCWDTVCCVFSQGREVRTAVTVCWRLTLTLLTRRIWWVPNNVTKWQMGFNSAFNPTNNELNPICKLMALLGAHKILHVSGLRVKSLNVTVKFSRTEKSISSVRRLLVQRVKVYR